MGERERERERVGREREVGAHMWRSEDNFVASVLSTLDYVSSCWKLKLPDKGLYLTIEPFC